MLRIVLLTLIWRTVNCAQKDVEITSNRTFNYNIYPYDTWINLYLNNSVEQVLDFYEKSEELHGYPTRVHVSSNDTLNSDYPLFITATQQKGVSSWELPLVVQTSRSALLFNDMGRTLCPHDAGPDIKTENRPSIHISTSNPNNVSVGLKLRRVTDFYIEINKEIPLNATPSSPKYYYFSFDQNPWNVTDGYLRRIPSFNYTIPKTVILIIESDDELCATVSIQNNSCPVFDNEKDVMYQGYHLTMTTKGGITLTQSMFPMGFYVVFIVRDSDEECNGAGDGLRSPHLWAGGRAKKFRFKVIPTISYKEYVIGALVTLAVVMLVPAFVLVVLMPCRSQCTEEITIEVLEPTACSSGERVGEEEVEEAEAEAARAAGGERQPIVATRPRAEEWWGDARALTVGRLTRAPPATLARRADRYFWGALTVAVVYALPVVQLLFTYQRMVFQTGDQDLCYYNFLCAHPLGFLSDFNHVFSNIGYILLGMVFMVQVRARQVKMRDCSQEMGIPQHYGLLYSMGLALSMEGVLSACYHLCPNKMNFQFDSSFMYVIAVLVMIKLYQNRHSDIIPSAHSTFMVLAVIMTIGLFGILYPSVYFSAIFTILHLCTCFVLTLKIYYAGQFKMEASVVGRAWRRVRGGARAALVPAHAPRALLLALAALANWAFAIYSATKHNKDFARQLLAILMGNGILYTMFYIVMKLVHKERILVHTWVYFFFAHIAWFTALWFFLDSKTKWSESPAQSRRHNAACQSLRFYDSHDLWHGISAAAMYLSFNMLLTVDDALSHTPRDTLPTF